MKTPDNIKKGTKCPWCGERMRFDADSVHCWFKCDNCLAASPKTRRVWDNAKGNKDNWDINKANARLLAQQFEAQVSRWISVEERLPEGEVLAANFAKGTYGYGEYIKGYVAPYSGSETNGYGAENSFELLDGVTHWMPLPGPPKGGRT